jgi:hypothetical protein
MLDLYGVAVGPERLGLDDGGEVGHYLRWEYGKGTGIGYLRTLVPRRRKTTARWASRLIDRLSKVSDAIRRASRRRRHDDLEPEMSLVVQWKQGRIRTVELVGLLEDLRRAEPVQETQLAP